MSKSTQNEFIIKWYSAFFQASYFIRKGLYTSVRLLAPQLHGRLLDFGCGAKPYKQLFTNASEYIGVDIEVSGHSHKDEHIDVYYDGKHLPFENATFDNIFSTEVFEHVFNIDDIIPELYRVLKPGGQLLITCPFVCPEHEKPYDYARYTSFGIKHLLEKHGFVMKEQLKTGNYIEAASQVKMYFVNYFIPKKPYFLYLFFYQIFILPIIAGTTLLNLVLPKRIKRDDMYHSNVVLVQKPL